MTYPFAGFGSLLFQQNEMPLMGTDTFWQGGTPILDQSHPLGAATDDLQLMGFTSDTRQWEAFFQPSRHTLLKALLGKWDTLVDWTRPIPQQQRCFFSKLEVLDRTAGLPFNTGAGDETRERRRLRLTFIVQ